MLPFKHLIIALVLLACLSAQSQAFSLSGDLLEGDVGLFLSFVYAVPASFDTFYITIANPFNLQYSFANLDSGGYLLFAYQDFNTSLLPDLDEPRGFYGEGGIPSVLVLQSDTDDVNIILQEPNSGGFSGTITYEGIETGATFVLAFRNSSFSGAPAGIGILLTENGNGDYTAFVDSFGVYYAYAFMDLNANFVPDASEPYGAYGGTTPDPIEIEPTDFPDDIDITMEVTNSIEDPALVLPATISVGNLYPNPFNSETTLPFSLSSPAHLSIILFDLLGREVSVLKDAQYEAGNHSLNISSRDWTTGLYFVELRANGVVVTKRMLILK